MARFGYILLASRRFGCTKRSGCASTKVKASEIPVAKILDTLTSHEVANLRGSKICARVKLTWTSAICRILVFVFFLGFGSVTPNPNFEV